MKKIIAIAGFIGLFASQVVTSSAGYFNTAPLITCNVQITRQLYVGSENNDVLILQNLLTRAGYLHATPNGYFGAQTRNAVKAFQRDNNILATGVVGPATRNAINERLCDTDLLDATQSYYGEYSSGITYVTGNDPFVQVINPPVSNPAVYATPAVTVVSSPSSSYISGSVVSPSYTSASSQIAGTNIVYNPQVGYTYGVTPTSGSVTVASPVANSVYNEGDTVQVRFNATNVNASAYTITFESSITNQTRTVGVLQAAGSYSFTLTKELLDAVCSGTCANPNQQGSFRVVVTASVVDIANNPTTLRAAIAPITVKRPYAVAASVLITASKTPVNSGEGFRLYVNTPAARDIVANNYVIRVRSTCPSVVTVSIAGAACGQDFTIPFNGTSNQQELPVIITNASWYKQDVKFTVTVSTVTGQVIGTNETTVSVNGAPFNW